MTTTTDEDADVLIDGSGSIILFYPQNDRARNWIEENVDLDNGYQPYWPTSLVTEKRYAPQLAEGMRDAGLVIADGAAT